MSKVTALISAALMTPTIMLREFGLNSERCRRCGRAAERVVQEGDRG